MWLDFYATRTPVPATSPFSIISTDAVLMFEKIDPATGHFCKPDGTSVLVTDAEGLDISKQKHCEFVGRSGFANADWDYVDRALKSCEAVFAYANSAEIDGVWYEGPDGSFPGQKKGSKKDQHQLHNKVICLDRVAQLLINFVASRYNTLDNAARLADLIDRLMVSAYWMAGSDDLTNFFRETSACNQLVQTATFLAKSAKLVADPALEARARALIEQIFANNIWAEGVCQEKPASDGVGFDGVYQSFSQELIGDYLLLQGAGSWRTQVAEKLSLCVNRWLLTVDQNSGLISDQGWTRCCEKLPRVPGAFPVDYDRDIIPLRSKYLRWLGLTGFMVPLDVLGDRMLGQGQSFGHINKADDALYA